MNTKARLGIAIAAAAFDAGLATSAKADAVTEWNQITLATQAAVAGGIRTPPAARALAMVHLAIFDSVNAIDRKYHPYVVTALADSGASPDAAVAAAAQAVLVSLYPTHQADLDAAYTASLALLVVIIALILIFPQKPASKAH